jgi:branched-chain amino acid transport system substrate-binding protein
MTTPSAGARALLLCITLSFLLISCSSDDTTPTSSSNAGDTVRIGGLFSRTGDWSTLGMAGSAALELAVGDVNDYLASRGSSLRFTQTVEDTKLDPASAYAKLRTLVETDHVSLVLGPQSSAELAALKPYADSSGVIIISPSSTAGSLSITGDHIYRFCPDDSHEGTAIAKLMRSDGVEWVVPIWKDDAGNGGLVTSLRREMNGIDGTVEAGVKYTDVGDVGAIISAASAQVAEARNLHGDSSVGVYLASFDEGVQILAAAKNDPALSAVRWYAGDGIGQSAKLTSDATAAAFAAQSGLASPLLGLDPASAERRADISERIHAKVGYDPDVYALAVYDAVWVSALTVAARDGKIDLAHFDDELRAQAGSYYGATGWTVLNDAGDRKYADFDFWAVRSQNGAYVWTPVAQFQSASGSLVRY